MPHPNLSDALNPIANPRLLTEIGELPQDELLAALDLGSNSFHLAIARVDKDEVRKVLSLSEKVQLGAGIDDNNVLSEEAMERGLACLQRFSQYLDAVAPDKLRVVATNALRKAVNRQEFIQRANGILPVPIELIAGREEARLIYLGVSHTNEGSDKRLVVDIGGGSTEFIIGKGFDPIEIESLQMGCVSYTKRFFADGKIDQAGFEGVMTAAKSELLSIAKRYKKTGFGHAMGSSGTVKACYLAICELGFGKRITQAAMERLKRYLIGLGHSQKIALGAIKPHRQSVFAAGVGELLAIMQVLEIDEMDYSDGALREGVLYDMLGRKHTENVKDRTVDALMMRYFVSQKQAQLVKTTAWRLLEALPNVSAKDKALLGYAALLHEIGLAVSHSGYHHHSSYLLRYSDMFGFSKIDQEKLAELTAHQRRKLKTEGKTSANLVGGERFFELCLLLRLAVIAHQSRSRHSAALRLKIKGGVWSVCVGAGKHREILISQLDNEVLQFAKWGVKLVVQATPKA